MSKKKNNIRYGRYQTEKEAAALKIGNNDPCPCGKTRKLEVFIVGKKEPEIVEVPNKYKKCCRGKYQFFSDADANRLGLKSKEEFLAAKQLEEKDESN